MRVPVLFLSAVLSTSPIFASSFELLHMYDRANNRIVRYDPINRIMLGTYGQGYAQDAYSLSVKSDVAMLWDFGGSEVHTFSASTGVPIQRFGVDNGSGISSEISAGIAHYNIGTRNATLYSTTGAVLGTLSAAGSATGYSSVFENSTHYFLYNAQTTTMRRFRKSDLALDLSWNNPNLFNTFLQWDVTTATRAGQFQMVLADRNSNRISFVNALNGGAQTYNLTNVSVINGLATGHANWVYAAVTTTNSRTQILRINPNTGQATVVLDEPLAAYTIESMSIVIAPEPGTLVALGAGALVLLRRRKKQG